MDLELQRYRHMKRRVTFRTVDYCSEEFRRQPSGGDICESCWLVSGVVVAEFQRDHNILCAERDHLYLPYNVVKRGKK